MVSVSSEIMHIVMKLVRYTSLGKTNCTIHFYVFVFVFFFFFFGPPFEDLHNRTMIKINTSNRSLFHYAIGTTSISIFISHWKCETVTSTFQTKCKTMPWILLRLYFLVFVFRSTFWRSCILQESPKRRLFDFVLLKSFMSNTNLQMKS